MSKRLFEKLFIVSFIGVILTVIIGMVGYDSIRAAIPALKNDSKKPVNELMILEKSLLTGKISRQEYDSLADRIKSNIVSTDLALSTRELEKELPDWLKTLGFKPPSDMVFEPVFSGYTTISNPEEGFNSAELVFSGNYDTALVRAKQYADYYKLHKHSLTPSQVKIRKGPNVSHPVVYLNYQLSKPAGEYLISVQVLPSGRLSIVFTDNNQLNEKLLTYKPLNNRRNDEMNRKK